MFCFSVTHSRKLLAAQPLVLGYDKATLFNQNQELIHDDNGFLVDQNAFVQLDGNAQPLLGLSSQDANSNCTPAAILEFPADGFTRDQRRSGWIAIHVLIACYCFWLIAIVCDDYFVPVIDSLCESASHTRLGHPPP